MNKKIIIIMSVLVLLIGTAATMWHFGALDGFMNTGKISNEKFEEVMKNEEFKEAQPVSKETVETKDIKVTVREEKDVWDEIHKMANTKIAADEIWGKVDITTERINMLILELEKSNFKTKNELLKILYRWKDGDYRDAVNDHNYVWNLLGGTVGEAKDLNQKTKEEMIEKFGEN